MGSFCSFWPCIAFQNLSRFSLVNFISSARASASSFTASLSGATSFTASLSGATSFAGADSLARERFGEESSSSFSSNKFLEIPNILLFIEPHLIFFLNASKTLSIFLRTTDGATDEASHSYEQDENSS